MRLPSFSLHSASVKREILLNRVSYTFSSYLNHFFMLRLKLVLLVLIAFPSLFLFHSCGYVMYPDMPQTTHFDERHQGTFEVGATTGTVSAQAAYAVTDFAAVALHGSYFTKQSEHLIEDLPGVDTSIAATSEYSTFGASAGYIFPNHRWQLWLGATKGRNDDSQVWFFFGPDFIHYYQTSFDKYFLQLNFIPLTRDPRKEIQMELHFYGQLAQHRYEVTTSTFKAWMDSAEKGPSYEDEYLYLMGGLVYKWHFKPIYFFAGGSYGKPVTPYREMKRLEPILPLQMYFGLGLRIN